MLKTLLLIGIVVIVAIGIYAIYRNSKTLEKL